MITPIEPNTRKVDKINQLYLIINDVSDWLMPTIGVILSSGLTSKYAVWVSYQRANTVAEFWQQMSLEVIDAETKRFFESLSCRGDLSSRFPDDFLTVLDKLKETI